MSCFPLFRHYRMIWVASVVLLSLLAGCSDLLPPSFEYGSIAVHARRISGEPVPDVGLVLYAGQRHMAYGRTAVDGRFTFQFVPLGYFGVGAVAPQGYQIYWGRKTFVENINVGYGAHDSIAFVFVRTGQGTLHVRATERSGAPVPGAPLTLYTFRGVADTARTDQEGRHTFRSVEFGQYGVAVAPLLGYRPVRGYLDGIDIEGGSEQTVSLLLERCEGRVRVRVLDGSGRPFSGVNVTLYTHLGTVSRGRTDGSGTYEFREVKCGLQYGAGIELPPATRLISPPHPYVDGIDPAQTTETTITFRLQACEGQVAARVVDRAGTGVPGAVVTLYSVRTTVATGTTDVQGRYLFREVPCGNYGVRVDAPQGYTVRPGRGTAFVDGIEVEQGSQAAARLVLDRS